MSNKRTFRSMADIKHSLAEFLFDLAMMAGILGVYMVTVAVILMLINILVGCDARDNISTFF